MKFINKYKNGLNFVFPIHTTNVVKIGQVEYVPMADVSHDK